MCIAPFREDLFFYNSSLWVVGELLGRALEGRLYRRHGVHQQWQAAFDLRTAEALALQEEEDLRRPVGGRVVSIKLIYRFNRLN